MNFKALFISLTIAYLYLPLLGCQIEPRGSVVVPSAEGDSFLLNGNNLDELKSPVLNTCLGRWDGETVSSATLKELFTLLNSCKKSDRLTAAQNLPLKQQLEFCLLYNSWQCNGFFEHGIHDAKKLLTKRELDLTGN